MIEIRKHGNLVDRKYLTGCTKCKCEFWFYRGDYFGENSEGVAIKCPECGHVMTGKYMGDISWTAEVLK